MLCSFISVVDRSTRFGLWFSANLLKSRKASSTIFLVLLRDVAVWSKQEGCIKRTLAVLANRTDRSPAFVPSLSLLSDPTGVLLFAEESVLSLYDASISARSCLY